jgi:hypothetical protein
MWANPGLTGACEKYHKLPTGASSTAKASPQTTQTNRANDDAIGAQVFMN